MSSFLCCLLAGIVGCTPGLRPFSMMARRRTNEAGPRPGRQAMNHMAGSKGLCTAPKALLEGVTKL